MRRKLTSKYFLYKMNSGEEPTIPDDQLKLIFSRPYNIQDILGGLTAMSQFTYFRKKSTRNRTMGTKTKKSLEKKYKIYQRAGMGTVAAKLYEDKKLDRTLISFCGGCRGQEIGQNRRDQKSVSLGRKRGRRGWRGRRAASYIQRAKMKPKEQLDAEEKLLNLTRRDNFLNRKMGVSGTNFRQRSVDKARRGMWRTQYVERKMGETRRDGPGRVRRGRGGRKKSIMYKTM